MVDRITLIFFICNGFSGAFHYLFNVIMIRLLPLGEVGDMGKLLNMLVLITIPLAAFQNVVTQSVATWTAREEYQLVKALWKRLSTDALIVGACLCGGIWAGASRLQTLYGLPSIWPLYVMATVPLPMVLVPTMRGILQGAQAFVTLGFNLVFEGFARVAVGLVAVLWITQSSSGALAASTGAGMLSLALGMWAMRPILERPSQKKADLNIGEVYRYAVPVMLAQLALAAMTFMDLPILGPKFSREDSGLWFGAETCAKIVFFLPIPLSGLMFARVAGAEAKGEPTRPLILKTLGLALALCLGVVAVFAVAPEWVLKTVGGVGKLEGAEPLLIPFGFAMTGFALTYALVSYHLSRKAMGFLPPFFGMTVLQGAALWKLPYDPGSAVSVLLASSVAHLAVQLWLTFRTAGPSLKPEPPV